MQLLSKYKWLGLLGIVATLVFVIGFERPPEAHAFTTVTCIANTNNPNTCPPNPYFFVNPGGGTSLTDDRYLTGFSGPHGYGIEPTGIAITPNDGPIYVADYDDARLYVFPSIGGPPTPPTGYPIGGCIKPIGLVISQAGKLYVACNNPGSEHIAEIDFTGNVILPTITTPANAIVHDLITDGPDLLVSAVLGPAGIGTIYRINTTTRSVTPCASGPEIVDPDGIVIDRQPSTPVLYVSNHDINVDKVARVPGVCGTPDPFSAFPAAFPSTAGLDGIAIGAVGSACEGLMYVNANDGNLYEVTIANPSLTPRVIASSPSSPPGTERGDLVKVDDRGFLFATQRNHVAKIGPGCFETPVAPVCAITILKHTIPAGNTLPGGGPGFLFSSTSGLSDTTLSDTQGISKLVPCGSHLNLFETPTAGWSPTNITCTVTGGGSFSFTSHNTVPVVVTLPFFAPGDNEVDFTLGPGSSTLECTFTNSEDACITIIKKTDPFTNMAFKFEWVGPQSSIGTVLMPIPLFSPFTQYDGQLDSHGQPGYPVCGPPGTYYFREVPPPPLGYRLEGQPAGIKCIGGGTNTFHTAPPTGFTDFLAAGDNVTCTFTNCAAPAPACEDVGAPVGGIVELQAGTALPLAVDSGSPFPWTPLAAVAASVMAVIGAGLWYGKRRWLR